MSREEENLSSLDAKKKFRELVEHVKVCMMISDLSTKPLSANPMQAKEVDESGNVWFLTGRDSNHFEDFEKNSECQLFFSDAKSNFLSVYGNIEIDNSRVRIEELYSSFDNAYFDGKEDPRIVALKFTPEQAAYWSADQNRLVTLFKLGYAAITGKDQDLGSYGKMEL